MIFPKVILPIFKRTCFFATCFHSFQDPSEILLFDSTNSIQK